MTGDTPRSKPPSRKRRVAALPGGRPLQSAARGQPGADTGAVGEALRAGGQRGAAVARQLVAELAEQVAGHGLERRHVLGAELVPPVAQARRRRTLEAALVWLRGRVGMADIVQHRGLEGQRGEGADPFDLRRGIRDEVLVANLEIAVGAYPPAERLRRLHLRPPLAGGIE